MMKRLQKMRDNRKGFTLVELIVVLVILAILAAMLVPALLGYIDRAREGKYEEEVHAIYTAIQVCYDEGYAKGKTPTFDFETPNIYAKEINQMVAPTVVTGIYNVNVSDPTTVDPDKAPEEIDPATVANSTITSFKVTFKSQENPSSTDDWIGYMADGVVTVIVPD